MELQKEEGEEKKEDKVVEEEGVVVVIHVGPGTLLLASKREKNWSGSCLQLLEQEHSVSCIASVLWGQSANVE